MKVMVLGAGTIGNLVGAGGQGLRGGRGDDHRRQPYKLEKARACGFEYVVNTGSGGPGRSRS